MTSIFGKLIENRHSVEKVRGESNDDDDDDYDDDDVCTIWVIRSTLRYEYPKYVIILDMAEVLYLLFYYLT